MSWKVTKPAGMRGLIEVEFLRPIDAKVDEKFVQYLLRNGVHRYGLGARTYTRRDVLLKKRLAVAGWREEVEKIARRFERT